jgi:hypothetical protein
MAFPAPASNASPTPSPLAQAPQIHAAPVPTAQSEPRITTQSGPGPTPFFIPLKRTCSRHRLPLIATNRIASRWCLNC